jgi:tRNA(Ile2) C34 agmatinyltransferase TiaS
MLKIWRKYYYQAYLINEKFDAIGNKIKDIKKEDIKKLALHAHKEANPIYPVPVLMNKKELEKFYYDLI